MSTIEPEHITSTKNQHVQQIRELLAKKATREQSGFFVVEGVRLCEEALRSGLLPKLVIYTSSLSLRGLELAQKTQAKGCKVISVTPEIMNTLSDTETAQGILMIVPNRPLLLPDKLDFVVIVDQVRDPGNLGTILRSAVAAGVQAVFCTPGCVDPWSPKVVRSAMGAHFHIPLLKNEWTAINTLLKKQKQPLAVYLAESGDGIVLWKADLKGPVALVIGGEADGASPEVKVGVDAFLNIPMPGGFESLNAGVAASIILFEVVRQRSL
jgi:TrmH family RNA methyltransferase